MSNKYILNSPKENENVQYKGHTSSYFDVLLFFKHINTAEYQIIIPYVYSPVELDLNLYLTNVYAYVQAIF